MRFGFQENYTRSRFYTFTYFSYITDFTTRHEKLYAQLDQLDDLLEPDEVEESQSVEEQVEMEVEEPEEETQGEPVKDVQKCSHCSFESDLPRIFKQHTNSYRICSVCNEIFCGARSARKFKSHQNKAHKPPNDCKACNKSFRIASDLKRHYRDSACGRQCDYYDHK